MNLFYAIKQLFPNATPDADYQLWDDADGKGPYIAIWNLEKPKPTESELQAAWEAYEAAEAAKEPEETDAEKLARLEAENADLLSRLGDVELILADVLGGGE